MSGLIIVWKEISFQIVIKKSKQTNSSSFKADAWHHFCDAITPVMAFIGIAIAIIFGKGYENADDWAALFASACILFNNYLILRPTLGEVMDEQLYDDLIIEIRAKSMEIAGVLGTEICFVRKAEISVKSGQNIAHSLKDYLQHEIPSLRQVLIHIEPKEENTAHI